jgi:hypothetical protein
MVTINKMREMLCEGFPEPQADLMARVFFSAHDELVTKAEFNELTAVTRELAEAQHMLANAQARTESRVEQLADAQARTESRLEQLANAQQMLADAQARTEWAVKDLAKQVGGLSNALGGSLEDFACDLVPEMLEKYWQMEVQSAATEELLIGRRYREIDVVVRGTVAGKPVTVLCEVKATVSRKEVDGFLAIIERYRSLHPDEDIRPLFFGYKADRRARERIVAEGTAMVFTRGVMLPVPRS